MLVTAATILCLLLPSQVNGLISTDAKCLSGYEWMSSSVGQSPCDVAAEIASVCTGQPFNLSPLIAGYTYTGPTVNNQNSCRCSSVYYSLLSGCAYCQGRNYRRWSAYNTNCTTVHLAVFTEQIPIGVKVQAYAYQDVSISDSFNVTLAYTMRGVESSRPPATPTSSQRSDSSISATSDSGSGGSDDISPQATDNTPGNNTPVIVGGVVGGLVGLVLVGALISFLILRSKRKGVPQNNPGFQQQAPNMTFSPNAGTSLFQSPPGSPVSRFFYNGDDHLNTHSFVDPNVHDPYRQYSPPLVPSNITGSTTDNNVSPPTMPQNPAALYYTGRPEL